MAEKELLHTLKGNSFHFTCHKGMGCFTKCCAALQLILTPYDIVRMKNRLRISSDLFLETYTRTRLDRHPRFPMVLLRMNNDTARACPFVSSEGAPFTKTGRELAAFTLSPGQRKAAGIGEETREKFYIVKEEHCQGFGEDRLWTVESWMCDQGLASYNLMNDQWLEIISSPQSLGPEKPFTERFRCTLWSPIIWTSSGHFCWKSILPAFSRAGCTSSRHGKR
jgi:uncharacterized protein